MQSFNFFNNLRSTNQQFAVIGLGRFGRAACETLRKQGYQVLGTDIAQDLVAQALDEKVVDNAIRLDSTQPNALRAAGIFEVDTAIVAIGKYVEESIITTLNLKEGGVHFVAAKASSKIHARLLDKVGADLVVVPEYDAGRELAFRLTKPAILERFDLDPESSIVEIRVPEEFSGRTIEELQLRNRYGLNVLAIGDAKRFKINPDPHERLYRDSCMVVIGSNRDIQRLPI